MSKTCYLYDSRRSRLNGVDELFLKYPDLFMPVMKSFGRRTIREVDGIETIFKENSVKPTRILDLACGIGRHSIELARRGFQVLGVDYAESYIDEAKKHAETAGVSSTCSFRVGDYRKLDHVLDGESFDAIVCVFNSLYLHDSETTISVLRNLQQFCNDGCILVFDAPNGVGLLGNWRRTSMNWISDEVVVMGENNYDVESNTGNHLSKYFRKEGNDLKHLTTIEFSREMIGLSDVKKHLEKAGWSYVSSYSDYELNKIDTNSTNLVLVGKKEG